MQISRLIVVGAIIIVGVPSGRAFAERPGYRIAKALEDRSAALFDDDLDLKAEINVVRANVDELNQERPSDPDLENVRRAAIRGVRRCAQTLDAYIDVESKAPGGREILEGLGKTLEDRKEDRDPETGEVTHSVKPIHVAETAIRLLDRLAAERQLRQIKSRYWRTCTADRTLVQQIWEFERSRGDLERGQLGATALQADVDDHFNRAYRGNTLAVRNNTDRAINSAVVFFVATYANHPNEQYWYMVTVDRLVPGAWAHIEVNPPDSGVQGGRVETMRAHLFGDHEHGIGDVVYDRVARDADIRRYLQDLEVGGRVVEATDSWWSGKHPRGFNLTFAGKSVPGRLNPSAVIVTFSRSGTVPVMERFTIQNWKKSDDQDFRSWNFTFDPEQIDVQLEFYDSDYVRSFTWNVRSQPDRS